MPAKAKTLRERFERNFIPEPNSGCWLWLLSLCNGYGRIYDLQNKRGALAHRLSWEIHRGAIPSGLWVLHKCDVRSCVNPDHLFLGTGLDNMTDMIAKGRQRIWNSGITHCKRGHEFTPNNTYFRKNGGRTCKICQREKVIRWRISNPERAREIALKHKEKKLLARASISGQEGLSLARGMQTHSQSCGERENT